LIHIRYVSTILVTANPKACSHAGTHARAHVYKQCESTHPALHSYNGCIIFGPEAQLPHAFADDVAVGGHHHLHRHTPSVQRL